MSRDSPNLERYDRLHGVQVARAILRDSFGLELIVASAKGVPSAHLRGGVMTSSTEVCRRILFSRDGFRRCDRFYRSLEGAPRDVLRPCHVGLGTLSLPAKVGDETVALLLASGFDVQGAQGLAPVRRAELGDALLELDPVGEPASAIAELPTLRGKDLRIVRSILQSAAEEIARAEDDRRRLVASDDALPGFWGLVGQSTAMQSLYELLRRTADSDATVLLIGESGTGKEDTARALWRHGRRSGRPFVAQGCGAIGDELLESTLFGHVRGAFSGALRANEGLFQAADRGVLFLDAVSEMSPALQVKLLRVLQDGTYLPVGATGLRTADVRIIASTRRDLTPLVETGEFRQDLYYRLHVVPIRLPPLRERTGDVPLLVQRFLQDVPGAPRRVSGAAWDCLERYSWPGNVRELRAEVQRWAVSATEASEIGPEHLSPPVREAGGYVGAAGGEAAARAAAGTGTLSEAVEDLERVILQRGLERTGGNRSQLARELDISRTTLGERLKRYRLGD